MPRVTLYVTAADKAFLDALPEGSTGAAILREGIARARRHGEDCEHAHQQVVCPDCGHRSDSHPVHTSETDPAAPVPSRAGP